MCDMLTDAVVRYSVDQGDPHSRMIHVDSESQPDAMCDMLTDAVVRYSVDQGESCRILQLLTGYMLALKHYGYIIVQ